ncbi:hypothetical protein [Spiroplasma eriocheiris]|uniref:Uncharacterized protein n=1 Tax=Spiroplasma eriocheiris TaxID=315358 RepID=A0A0H3XH50_9MOLU|nr:hypothetical protein [Spiroplasma eriocheiris]AHF57461.1 hypothetical protein SPE_0332 [Spiroplasma eriocheiris CCTCC M 207170]AKM53918.1 hypothetical protein SERIO_v1c03360 [Spiroplasma eriocheiris]
MNTQKNLYIIYYVEDPTQPRGAKIVKVFTSPEEAQKYLLTKVTVNGKKVNKDDKWIIQVYSYVGSNDRYEFSKWETGQFKGTIGICTHCHEYFLRENNQNMCADCFNFVNQGLKECDVCHQFFNPIGTKFTSNGDVFPSLACINCSELLLKNLKVK